MGMNSPELASDVVQASVIGSMLLDEKVIGRVLQQTEPSDFTISAYRTIYLAIRKQFGSGQPVDLVTLVDALKVDTTVNWVQLLRECMDITATAVNVDAYVPILREQARVARIRELAGELQGVHSLDEASGLIADLSAQQVDKPGLRITTIDQGLADFVTRHQTKVEYLPWGFDELNRRMYVGPGKFVILGGYPSDGKTAMALYMAWTMAQTKRVGFYSLETDDGTLMDRLVAHVSKINLPRIKRNELTDDDYAAVAAATPRMVERNLEIVLAAGMTVSDIFASAASRRYDVIFVDYIQLIRGDRRHGRTEEITGVSIDLHTMAQSSGLTVVGLSQLSRAEKGTKTKRAPRMSDLRESGQLEQDADVVMLLYRENQDDPQSRRILTVEKNKEGEVGKLHLNFDGEIQTFRAYVTLTPPPQRGRQSETSDEPAGQQTQFHELTEDDSDLPF